MKLSMLDYREINYSGESINVGLPWDDQTIVMKVSVLDYREMISSDESINVGLSWDEL